MNDHYNGNILEVRSLVKKFANTTAVNGISFEIKQGTCFGLLGPNGAGKTTTIEIMEGITQATSGEIRFRGNPINDSFKEKSGIQFQSTALPDFLTVKEVLTLFRKLYRDPASLEELVDLCDLKEIYHRDTHTLSGGQRQRVLLAIALVNQPEIVFLDEPTTGLDPQSRRSFWELIQSVKKKGKTVLLTTHYMEEAYLLCDEIAIMSQGTIIARGSPDHLLKKHFNGTTLELPFSVFQTLFQKTQHSENPLWKVTRKEEWAEIYTTDVNQTLKAFLDAKLDLTQLKVRSQTLEDLFLYLTDKDQKGITS